MKYFIVYKQPREPQNPRKNIFTQDEFLDVPGTSRLTVFDSIKNGELTMIRDFESFRIFNFTCEAKIRSKRGKIFVPDSFELWQQKRGKLITTIGANRKASKCATSMVSYSTFQDPFEIRPANLIKSDFLYFYEKVVEKMTGEVTSIFLSDVENPELDLKVRDIQLKGSHLERIPFFQEYLKYSGRIKSIGLALPNWVEGRLSFRITHWGGGQLWSPANPSDHQIAEFIDLMSQIIIQDT